MTSSRRALLSGFLAMPLVPLAGATAFGQEAPLLPLTRACADGDEPTPAREAGPFFKPNSPLKQDLYLEAPRGERITVAGYVLDDRCRPIPRSLVEIWQADENGEYDRQGFRLRGHQFADEQGRWWFNSVVPALYPGRTRHFHFRVQRPGGDVLTTQLFFPGEPGNVRDRIFDETLLMTISPAGDGQFARFDFVV
ncbi:intradiol ring-cleavage dioxygenase protein [Rhizobium etli 8C-3]|uniref:Intradiol ring-cleavage dioxygenase protein n=2 Tax=Rhizobium TaxID=379 RepID=A0A1L5NYM9_RHIET|nr:MULTISPECIES: intradiol ring-cleavage dioxygenase [Rhizobium]APO72946.1 intradiol ring-cleavage dioxygenase protein [Rhizobium etli 8C-3]TCU26947.1 protocatechuate 3,4-dioxygenase beta subunit [Rhizobium azibense]